MGEGRKLKKGRERKDTDRREYAPKTLMCFPRGRPKGVSGVGSSKRNRTTSWESGSFSKRRTRCRRALFFGSKKGSGLLGVKAPSSFTSSSPATAVATT